MNLKTLFATAVISGAMLNFGIAQDEPARPKPSVTIHGSDILLQVNLMFAQEYKAKTGKTIEVNGMGSSTGFKALVDGTAEIAASSRPVKDSEIKAIKAKRMEAPKEHVLAYEAIGVCVHPSNVVESLTLEQLGEIYGKGGAVSKWTDLNTDASGDLIERIGRANSSATYATFKKLLSIRGYKEGTAKSSGSKALVERVAADPNAIGYTSKTYMDKPGVKLLKIAKEEGAEPVLPSDENVRTGKYPLFRTLYFYTAGEPNDEAKTFLEWVQSEEGQGILAEQGFVTPAEVKEAGKKK